jgi:hypothetical protein
VVAEIYMCFTTLMMVFMRPLGLTIVHFCTGMAKNVSRRRGCIFLIVFEEGVILRLYGYDSIFYDDGIGYGRTQRCLFAFSTSMGREPR